MLRRKVNYAKLHSTIFIPGVGNIESTLPPSKTFKQFDMYLTDNDAIDITAVSMQGLKTRVLVAAANIQLAVFHEVEESAEDKSEQKLKKA